MSLDSWVLFLLGPAILFLIALAKYGWWSSKPPPSEALPDDLRARLGNAAADWLVATRRLVAQLTLLEEQAVVMLAEEQEGRTVAGRRLASREMDDASFFGAIRDVRRWGAQWCELAKALDEQERSRFDVDVEHYVGLFEIPWSLPHDFDPAADRSTDIKVVLDQTTATRDSLMRIDRMLTERYE
ncbi:MAG: hypothetical protein JKY37_30865 [Nannocystaceae bacterium]|nr:hypothetical protein [Nannocystaceae bacterium]